MINLGDAFAYINQKQKEYSQHANFKSKGIKSNIKNGSKSYDIYIACEQALLGMGGGRGKEERACNNVLGIFISASKKSMQNADWWILNLVLTSLLFRVRRYGVSNELPVF